jgi:hypothetical protein
MVRWIRLAPSALAGLLILVQAPPAAAQETASASREGKQVRELPRFNALAVSPAAAPIPAFRYSLLPSSARLNHGDAAPIYLRLSYDLPDEERIKVFRKCGEWLAVPIQDLPLEEVAATIAKLTAQFDLLAVGARRATCDWSYPLDEQRLKAIDLQLPDVNVLRDWGRLLALKARVEIAEGRFEDAAKTIETGFAFGRHVGAGPFLINGLVGVAIEFAMLDRVEDWVAAPGSPNLYWGLTVLPQPLLSLREAIEQERLLLENLIPELADADTMRPPAAWSTLFESMYGRMQVLTRRFAPQPNPSDGPGGRLIKSMGADLASYKATNLVEFRKQLANSRIFSVNQVEKMSDDEAAARGVALGYRTLWDEIFKSAYLPHPEADKLDAARIKLASEAKNGPFALFAALYPNLAAGRRAEGRLDRRVALLRTVEAVRMYAASHDGELPESLDAIHEAPIPTDPVTGGTFSLKVDGDVATLSAPNAPLMLMPDYKITIRKDGRKASPPR